MAATKGDALVALTQAGLTAQEAVRVLGGRATDGPLPAKWTEGWAVHPFAGNAEAHWWRRRPVSQHHPDKEVRSVVERACGRPEDWTIETRAVPLLGPGNVPRCRACQIRVGALVVHKVARR